MKSVVAVLILTVARCIAHTFPVYLDNIERYIGIYLQSPSKYNETTLRTSIDSYSKRFIKFYKEFQKGSKSAFYTAAVICNKSPPDWLKMYPNNLTLIQKKFKIRDVDLDCMSISWYDLKKAWKVFLTACKTKVEFLKFMGKRFH